MSFRAKLGSTLSMSRVVGALTVGAGVVHQTVGLSTPAGHLCDYNEVQLGGQPLFLGRAVEWQTGER